MYKIEELSLYSDLPEEQERGRKIFLSLKNRATIGKPLSEHEKDFLGRCLKLSQIDSETVDDYPCLDNFKFKSLYLIYFRDITGGSRYYKHIGQKVYIPSPSEVNLDLKYLYDKSHEWDLLVHNKIQQSELLKQVSKEARQEIKQLQNIPEFKNDPFSKGRFTYKYKLKALLLQSRYIYCKSLELFEQFSPSDFILRLNGNEIEITPNSIIHILTRHFSQITKQYPTTKSFHNEDFKLDLLHIHLQNIFNEIDKSQLIKTFKVGNIQFRFNKRDYSIWISEKNKTIKGKGNVKYLRVDTFYPIDETKTKQNLKTDYDLHLINSDLSIYLPASKN